MGVWRPNDGATEKLTVLEQDHTQLKSRYISTPDRPDPVEQGPRRFGPAHALVMSDSCHIRHPLRHPIP